MKSKQLAELLEGELILLSPPAVRLLVHARKVMQRGWTKDAFAVDVNDRPISEKDPNAVAFCAMGSLQRAAWELGNEQALPTGLVAAWELEQSVKTMASQKVVATQALAQFVVQEGDPKVLELALPLIGDRLNRSYCCADHVVTTYNDKLENKEQALQWFDRVLAPYRK